MPPSERKIRDRSDAEERIALTPIIFTPEAKRAVRTHNSCEAGTRSQDRDRTNIRWNGRLA
jgi:hypothetical protein